MVQILPQRTSLGNAFGQAVGSGLSSGIQQGSEVGFQRGVLQNALKGLENLPPETTPAQLASKVAYAFAGIPGSEKYVNPIFQSLASDLAARQKEGSGLESALGRQFSPQNQEQSQESTNPVSGTSFTREGLQQLLGEKFFPNIQVQAPIGSPESLKTQKPLVPPEPIGPVEEAKIRAQLRNQGVTNPEVLNEQIEKLKGYQNDVYKAQKEGFENIADYQAARLDRDNNFFKESEIPLGEAHGQMTPAETNIWRELSRQYEDLPNPERFSNTEQIYNTLVANPLIEFETSQKGLPIGSLIRPEEVRTRMDFARSSIQNHLEKIEDREDLPRDLKGKIKNNLRDQYFNEMGRKDFGIAQAAYATYNLNPKVASSIPKAPPPKETMFDTNYLSNPKEREKFTYSLANWIGTLGEEDSLLLAREKALSENYDDRAFNQALNLAIQSGKLKLSDRQLAEKSKLSIPQRLDLDSIMEGFRDVYDLFKGKK